MHQALDTIVWQLQCPHQRANRMLMYMSVFAGKDASRALAKTSLKKEDCSAEWEDLPDKEKAVLNDWFTFFSKRYNIVGRVDNGT